MKVLIIDDDQLFISKIEEYLDLPKQDIFTSTCAENAVHYIKDEPDIILLDNILPKLNGVEIISLFKEKLPYSRVILLSSELSLDDVAKAIQEKCDFVVEKKDITKEYLHNLIETTKEARKSKRSFKEIFSFLGGKKTNPNKNIAIVEDDEMFSFKLSWFLEKNQKNQNNIYQFISKDSFFKSLDEIIPDIIFLDYNLRKETGMEVLTRVKKDYPKTRIIMISAQEKTEIAIETKKNNCDGYIVKNSDWINNLESYISEFEL